MSLIFATQLTAVATAVLGFFAIITALYAIKAFRKQSQEVRDTAEGLRIQGEQLGEQRKFNAEQMKVMALQATELRESLAERKREEAARMNAQASRVHIAVSPFALSAGSGVGCTALIMNASERSEPVYDVRLYWHLGQQMFGTPNPVRLGTLLAGGYREERVFPDDTDPDSWGAILSFRDATGRNWIRQADGGLMRADPDLVPDIIRRMPAKPDAILYSEPPVD